MKHRLIAWLLIIAMSAGCLVSPAFALSTSQTDGDWKYEIESDGFVLTAYLGKDSRVIIPSELAGRNVVRIGIGCFKIIPDLWQLRSRMASA